MPFTLAHPAIILPIKRHYPHLFSITGLIAGSIAPDIEGIYTLGFHRGVSHTILGIFLVDLPIGIIISVIFHHIIKQPLLKYSFGYFKRRGIAYSTLDWRKYCLSHPYKVCLSILVGICLHIIWDYLTHFPDDAFLVGQFCSYVGFNITNVGTWLQVGSTILGLLFIVIYIHRLPVSAVHLEKHWLFYWAIVLLVMLSVMAFRYRLFFLSLDMFVFFKTILCGLFTGLFCASLVFKYWR